MQRRILVLLGMSAAVLILGPAGPAGAGGGGQGICDGFTRGQTLVMRDMCFQGATHFAEPDATVVVRNEGQTVHDIVAVDGSFASARLAPGETFNFSVARPGIVPFYCTLHGNTSGTRMTGVLIVGDPKESPVAALASATDNRTAKPDRRDVIAVVRAGDPTAVVVLGGATLLVAAAALGLVAMTGVRSRRDSSSIDR